MNLFKSVEIIEDGRSIIVQRSNGSILRYHSTWLRDNSLDVKTRDKKNGQRLISISDIPVNTYIKSASLDKKGKNITLDFLPNKKKIKFSTSWLESHTYDKKKNNSKVWIDFHLKTWSKTSLKIIPNTPKNMQVSAKLNEYGFSKPQQDKFIKSATAP